MNGFAGALRAHNTSAPMARTENGDVTHASTGTALLDMFSKAGALRLSCSNAADHERQVLAMFTAAYKEHPVGAIRAMFYFRDVRGGQGERRLFRTCLTWLVNEVPEVAAKILKHVAEFGRWDDLYAAVSQGNAGIQHAALTLMRDQFNADLEALRADANAPISLVGKWLKSENTSSRESRRLGSITREFFGLSPKQYRVALTKLRKRIKIVESLMSAGEWSEIDYSKLPSRAGMLYRDAFKRRDGARYAEFQQRVANGEVTINAGTLYPYELVKRACYDPSIELDNMWKALPNYVGEEEKNALVVADVSSSMDGDPMMVSVAMALYASERCKGPFHNMFITFNTTPEVIAVRGNTLYEKVRNTMAAPWGGSTNMDATFKLILDTAVRSRAKQEEMPEILYIVSDMQFNAADRSMQGDTGKTVLQRWRSQFEAAGYRLPQIVFWNVRASVGAPARAFDEGVMLVSGLSPSVFKSTLQMKHITPYDAMMEILFGDRYAEIQL